MADQDVIDREARKGKKVLTVSEVSFLADQVVAARKAEDSDFVPNGMLLKVAEYGQRFATNKNRATIDKIRDVCATAGLSEEEVGLVVNLSPQTAEEARTLVPTLQDTQRFSDEDLDQLLQELATYREFE